ncbi:MAG: stage III sporulation protein AB [Oscillibacter sp.]|nr:stage III sporulation protein AB [Oscillibacter sp.]
MKLMGALCIACGAVWGRWQQLSAQRRRRETVRGLIAALRQMAEEIRIARTPMPQLLSCLGRSRGGEAGRFFHAVAAGLESGHALPEAWRLALADLSLPDEPMTVLRELAAGLSGDEEAVYRAVTLAADALERQALAWERQRPEAERRGNALWFSASALLVILLI